MTNGWLPLGSRPRRPRGQGSIYETDGSWAARIALANGKRVIRKRRTREEAEQALDELKVDYRNELGLMYRNPRPLLWMWREKHGRGVRAGISPRVRFDIFTRDGFRCVYCGATAKEARLQVDHRIPVSRGGTDDPENLATACVECNLGKADRP